MHTHQLADRIAPVRMIQLYCVLWLGMWVDHHYLYTAKDDPTVAHRTFHSREAHHDAHLTVIRMLDELRSLQSPPCMQHSSKCHLQYCSADRLHRLCSKRTNRRSCGRLLAVFPHGRLPTPQPQPPHHPVAPAAQRVKART